MKNHWLELHRKKLEFFWTAEFTELGSFVLKPRIIELENISEDYGISQGRVSIIFNSISQLSTDSELTNFLNFSPIRMFGWRARLRKYKNTFSADELELFHLDGLSLHSIGTNFLLTGIKFTFDYSYVKHYRTI